LVYRLSPPLPFLFPKYLVMLIIEGSLFWSPYLPFLPPLIQPRLEFDYGSDESSPLQTSPLTTILRGHSSVLWDPCDRGFTPRFVYLKVLSFRNKFPLPFPSLVPSSLRAGWFAPGSSPGFVPAGIWPIVSFFYFPRGDLAGERAFVGVVSIMSHSPRFVSSTLLLFLSSASVFEHKTHSFLPLFQR